MKLIRCSHTKPTQRQPAAPQPNRKKSGIMKSYKTIYLAGGSFWGTQQYIRNFNGIVSTCIGYANSRIASPRYREVCQGKTGAAECVRVDYDPARISIDEIVRLFFMSINPTSVNRQGSDIGPQYRTGIYFTDSDDGNAIFSTVAVLEDSYDAPIAVEIMPLKNFYRAEKSLQNYLERAPGGHCTISQRIMDFARGNNCGYGIIQPAV